MWKIPAIVYFNSIYCFPIVNRQEFRETKKLNKCQTVEPEQSSISSIF